MRARVVVTLKSGILDRQGKAIECALNSLGVPGISSVRQGKIFDIEVEATSGDEAESVLRQACERLLANTVIENFEIEVERVEAQPQPEAAAPLSEPADTGDMI